MSAITEFLGTKGKTVDRSQELREAIKEMPAVEDFVNARRRSTTKRAQSRRKQLEK